MKQSENYQRRRKLVQNKFLVRLTSVLTSTVVTIITLTSMPTINSSDLNVHSGYVDIYPEISKQKDVVSNLAIISTYAKGTNVKGTTLTSTTLTSASKITTACSKASTTSIIVKTTEIKATKTTSNVQSNTTTSISKTSKPVKTDTTVKSNKTTTASKKSKPNTTNTTASKTTNTDTKTTTSKKVVKKVDSTYKGQKLTPSLGVVQGPSGKETYYNYNMSLVVQYMKNLGYDYEYWVREDGVKMYGDYVMCAANLKIRPKGSLVPTSLGMGIVCDTGAFASQDIYQLDIAVAW